MRFWMKPLAAALERGEAAMLVHVVGLSGSAPREAGAQMLVTETDIVGTIGGGQLEHSAEQAAREHLGTGRAGLIRWALGPELGQCCGGTVTLAFEPFAPADLAWIRKLIQASDEPEPVFRTMRLDEAGNLRRDWSAQRGGETVFTATLAGGRLILRERVNAPAQAVWLFGAGHVGRAVAKALAPLDFAVTWIDGRQGQFPAEIPDGVRTMELAMPELAVEEAPAGTIFLVMSHSHPLDEAICEAVLKRGDFGYLGLIGSDTKAKLFRRRLAAAGAPATALDRLVCPIGLPAIQGKDPAVIAASVAADLVIRTEQGLPQMRGAIRHEH